MNGNRRIIREYDASGALARIRSESLKAGPTPDLPPVERHAPPAPSERAPAASRLGGFRFRKPAENAAVKALDLENEPPAPAATPSRDLPVTLESYEPEAAPPFAAEPEPVPEPLPDAMEAEDAPEPEEAEPAVARRPLPVPLEPYAEPVEAALEPEPEPTPAPPPSFHVIHVEPVAPPAYAEVAEAAITLPEPEPQPEPVLVEVAEASVALPPATAPETIADPEPAFTEVAEASITLTVPKKPLLARLRRSKPAPVAQPVEPEPQPEEAPKRGLLARFRRERDETPAPAAAAEEVAPAPLVAETAAEPEVEAQPEPEPLVAVPEPESTPEPEPQHVTRVPVIDKDREGPQPVRIRYSERVPDVESRVDEVLAAREAQRKEAKKRKPIEIPHFAPLPREAWEERLDAMLKEA